MITQRRSRWLVVPVGLLTLLVLAVPADLTAQTADEKGYLDYLDSYYQTNDLSDLRRARSSIKTDLDSSVALRFQGYYYNAEIQYLLAIEELQKNPGDEKKLQELKGLMLQLYGRYLDAYYQIDRNEIHSSSIPGNTAFLFKDMLMAAAFIPNANSCAPLVNNVLRRANRDSLYNPENSFVASVNDMLELEYPNLFGVANLVKAVWLNDKFMSIQEESAAKDSLREMVNYYASNAADTLKSDYGMSIAYFLLAETYANHSNDMAWDYFQKCINIFHENDIATTGFYARNYNQEVYLATAVAFLPAYSEFLFQHGRYAEIVAGANYLIELRLLDRGKMENVTKEAIFWGEKSIRQLQDSGKYSAADELFQQVQGFYELLEHENRYRYGEGPGD
jgi:hypothetical protein